MRSLSTLTLCVIAEFVTTNAVAQGPVRDGLRQASQAVSQGARAAIEGAANVADGVVDATVGSSLDRGPQARWRFTRHNGEWWYYAPNNQWMYHRNNQWHAHQPNATLQMNHRAQDPQLAHRAQPIDGGDQHTAGYRGGAVANSQATSNQSLPVEQDLAPVRERLPAHGNYDVGHVPTRSAYSSRRYSYAPDVSRVPAGSERNVESRYSGGAHSPRELNNNPRSATWGAVKR